MKKIQTYWENCPTLQIRPLSEISDFVKETMPLIINHIVNEQNPEIKQGHIKELSKKIEILFSKIDSNAIARIKTMKNVDIALLDCKMCAMALWHSGVSELPVSLEAALESLCKIKEDPIIMTYEDIVLNNPESDLRLFFCSKTMVGQHEEIFYRAHQEIEKQIIPAVDLIRHAVESKEILNETMTDIQKRLRHATHIGMLLKNQLDNKSFLAFRKYLSKTEKYPHGPSGEFTGSYPLIDLLCCGRDYIFEKSRKIYIDNNQYFPSFQRNKIKHLASIPSPSVKSCAEEEIKGFTDLLAVLYEEMSIFKKSHLQSVKDHLPEVFDDKAESTGGLNNPGTYLKESSAHTNKQKL